MSHQETRQFWERASAGLAARVNVAVWLERFAPLAFGLGSAAAIGLYALRRLREPTAAGWGIFAAGAAVLAAFAWWRARRGFFGVAEARVLLEYHLRLDTRLTAAATGVGAWPARMEQPARGIGWRLQAAATWLGASGALLALALLLPVPAAPPPRPVGPLPAVLQTQEMIAALKELDVVDPQALEQLAQRAEELARRPAEEQLQHSALEAADALRDQTAAAGIELGKNLESAADALRSATTDADGAAGRLAASISGLRDGALPANGGLLSKLPGNATSLKALSAEQLARLAQQLAESGKLARGVGGAKGEGAKVAQGDGDSTIGSGGPGGGGPAAPLAFSDEQSQAGPGKTEALASRDPTQGAALGDKLGTTRAAPESDPAREAGPMAAGAVAAPARGGEAVWVNRLTPAERAAVKSFFK